MLQVQTSLIFGGSDPTLTVFRCFIPDWLVTILEKEREMEAQMEMPEADSVFNSTVFGEEFDSLGSMAGSFAKQLSRKHSQFREDSGRGLFSAGLDSSQGSLRGSSIPEVELCESPQHLHGKGVTRNLMLA